MTWWLWLSLLVAVAAAAAWALSWYWFWSVRWTVRWLGVVSELSFLVLIVALALCGFALLAANAPW